MPWKAKTERKIKGHIKWKGKFLEAKLIKD